MFSRPRLRTRLALLLGLSALSVVAAIAFGAVTPRERMTQDRVRELAAVVQSTVSIARGLEAQVYGATTNVSMAPASTPCRGLPVVSR
jgi:methyl-accepting chemotaxis protein